MSKLSNPYVKYPKGQIETLKKQLVAQHGSGIKDKVLDYEIGNNGRVAELVRKTLIYLSNSESPELLEIDELPRYEFPIMINRHLTIKASINGIPASQITIYEKILVNIHEGACSDKAHEYNIFKKYINIDLSLSNTTALPKKESELTLHTIIENMSDRLEDTYDANLRNWDNEYYNDQLDMDQQSPDFWDSL